MKAILMAAAGIIATVAMMSSASAEVRNSVIVRTVSFDGKFLDVKYSVGGGCKAHEGRVDLNVDTSVTPAVIALDVYDVSPEPDFCKAALFRTLQVDLKEMIAKYEQETGTNLGMPTLVLPKVTFDKYLISDLPGPI